MQKSYLCTIIVMTLLCASTSMQATNIFNKKHKKPVQQTTETTTTQTNPQPQKTVINNNKENTHALKKNLETNFKIFISDSKDFENVQPDFSLTNDTIDTFIILCTTTKNLSKNKLQQLTTALYDWASKSDFSYEKIKEIIDKNNASSEFTAALKITVDDALRKATENNDGAAADYALSAGADVNKTIDDYNNTLAHLAAYYGSNQVLSKLIEKGCKSSKNNLKETALHLAAEADQLECIKILVKNGWDSTEKDCQYKQARDFTKNPEIIRYLRIVESIQTTELYPTFDEKDLHDFIEMAIVSLTDGAIMKMLAKWAIAESSQTTKRFEAINYEINLLPNGNSKENLLFALQKAKDTLFLEADSLEKIKNLITSGASVFAKNSTTGENKLHQELKNSYPNKDTITYLLEKGLDVNAIKDTPKKETPLHMVKTVEIAKLLIEKGANFNLTDDEGNTPLHKKIIEENDKLIELYLGHGADINTQNNDGNTPLHLAHDTNSLTLVQRLLGQNPNVTIKNNSGVTALDPKNKSIYVSIDLYCTACKEFSNIIAGKGKHEFKMRTFAITKLNQETGLDFMPVIDPFVFFGNKKHLEWLYNWATNKNLLSYIIDNSQKSANAIHQTFPSAPDSEQTRSWIFARIFMTALKRYSVNAPMVQEMWEEALKDKNINKDDDIKKQQEFFNDVIKNYPPVKPLQKNYLLEQPSISQN